MINDLKHTLKLYSNKYLNYLYYKQPLNINNFTILLMLKYVNIDCLSKNEISKYKELVNYYTLNCDDLPNYIIINSEKQLDWDLENPQCTSRKRWEKLVLGICTKYNINIEITKTNNITDKHCNLALDIIKNNISCNILTGISLRKEICNNNIKIEKTIGDCYHSYKLLIDKYPNCNLSLKNYHKLINDNYSHTFLEEVYKSDNYITIEANGHVNLNTFFDTYNIPNDIETQSLLLSADCTIISNFLNDYNIPNNIKQKILDGKVYI